MDVIQVYLSTLLIVQVAAELAAKQQEKEKKKKSKGKKDKNAAKDKKKDKKGKGGNAGATVRLCIDENDSNVKNMQA